MLIIGEKINTTRKSMHEAVIARDSETVQREARIQVEAGAHLLDVNCGSLTAEEEPEALAWMVQTVQAVTDVPLCVDSPNPAALVAALAAHRGRPMINSISGETARYEAVIPLVKQYQAQVVVLGMDDRGIPKDSAQALEVGIALMERLTDDLVPGAGIYFDPLVRSLATNPESIAESLELMRELGSRFPGMHFVSGLSNVSYGLPERRHINRAFVVLSIASGLDAVIMDPLDRTMGALIYAAEALMNKDRFCMKYIKAFQEGRLAG